MLEVCCAWRRSAERVSSATRPSRADVEALEEAEAETVVAGQPIVALLREQQQAVELLRRHRGGEAGLARGHFAFGKMDGHCFSLLFKSPAIQEPGYVKSLAIREPEINGFADPSHGQTNRSKPNVRDEAERFAGGMNKPLEAPRANRAVRRAGQSHRSRAALLDARLRAHPRERPARRSGGHRRRQRAHGVGAERSGAESP